MPTLVRRILVAAAIDRVVAQVLADVALLERLPVGGGSGLVLDVVLAAADLGVDVAAATAVRDHLARRCRAAR